MLNAIEPESLLSIHRHMKSTEKVVCLWWHLREAIYGADGFVTEIIDLALDSNYVALIISV